MIINCHDCGKTLETKKDKIISGYLLEYKTNGESKFIIKCKECYEADKSFKQKCEVYSRVVGYIRPVSQWNRGKKKEYKDRKEYKKRSVLKDTS